MISFFSAATFAKKGLWGFSTGELDSTAILSQERPLNKKRGKCFKLNQERFLDDGQGAAGLYAF